MQFINTENAFIVGIKTLWFLKYLNNMFTSLNFVETGVKF